MESGQDQIVMNHIKGELLETIVKFIYTGTIHITRWVFWLDSRNTHFWLVDRDTAVDILEAVTCLQIGEASLLSEIKKVLVSCVRSAVRFEELFYIWNISVTYDLDEVEILVYEWSMVSNTLF